MSGEVVFKASVHLTNARVEILKAIHLLEPNHAAVASELRRIWRELASEHDRFIEPHIEGQATIEEE